MVQNGRGGELLERWDRFAPLTGIWTVALWVVSVVVLETMGDTPDEGSPQEVLEYFESDEVSIYIGAVIFLLGAMILIWWSSALRASILNAGGLGERLAPIAFAAGVATAILAVCTIVPQISGGFGANESDAGLSPEAAQALWTVGDGFFVATAYAAALLLVATALAILYARFLPTWLAWVSFVVAAVLVVPPIGWAALIFGFPLWIVAVSLLLWRRGAPAAAPMTREVTPP